MNDTTSASPSQSPRALGGLRHVFIDRLTVMARIGVHAHEKLQPQRLIISVDLTVDDDRTAHHSDDLASVVCYETVVRRIEAFCRGEHINLLETLAEKLAELCLADPRVQSARLRIEKPDAFANAAAVGIAIERFRAASRSAD
ncbi:MAG: dihydroneopterin aldolase [Hyphomicrobiaceae bacterium]|nr:dihydroneopterin aldolase [Hyphomicrobiaceae bacterium]